MKKTLLITLLLCISACTSKALLTVEQVAVPTLSSGQQLSLENVTKAIVAGSRQKGWTAKKIQPGLIEASINVRSHMAAVTIEFTQDYFSINYKDSTNLNYKDSKGKLKIHRSYNKWVVNLSNAIQNELYTATDS